MKKEFSTQEFKEQKEKETTFQHVAKHTSKGKKRCQHKEVENKVHEKEHVLQIISDDIQCKLLSNSEKKEVKVDVAMETKSPVPKKHGKHFCKKCAMSFATSHVLTKHIQKFHKFGSSQFDHKDSDSDIDVLYDADDKPSCVKSFKEEINENICSLCDLKFLTGQMLKLHNSRHHPELNKKTKSEEKVIVKAEHVHKPKIKQEVGMGLSCIKCNDKFSTKQQLTTHMIKKHQKDEKYKKRKYALLRKVTT